ncbi:MAG: PaREP1 family protein [Nitrososphaerales archaeon]
MGKVYKRHVELNDKYLKEANTALARKDFLQASEKLWGAAAQAVKAVAAKRGVIIRSHERLCDFVERLDQDYPEWHLAEGFSIASALHTNFYEGRMPPRIVERNAGAVREFIERLVSLV